MIEVREIGYAAANGWTIKRAVGGPHAGKWVLKNEHGAVVDVDAFRNDLFERNGLKVDDMADQSPGNKAEAHYNSISAKVRNLLKEELNGASREVRDMVEKQLNQQFRFNA